jgi:hypothetical protein
MKDRSWAVFDGLARLLLVHPNGSSPVTRNLVSRM